MKIGHWLIREEEAMKALKGLTQLLKELHRRKKERLCLQRQLIGELIREQMICRRQQHECCQEDLWHERQAVIGPEADRSWQQHKQKFLKNHQEFHRYYRRLRRARPLIILFNLVIWYLIFRYLGVKTVAVVFAALISLGGVYELFFLHRLEKRIFEPIDKLKQGVEEIARGNYDVMVECDVFNDLTLLVASFNYMAQQLQANEKLKVEYEENRKKLIANISHDLKTPITSIQGYIEAILERPDQPVGERQKYLRIIHNNTVYMNKLIDDLFLFAKLDMDKLEFQFEQIRLRDFMADLMEEFRLELEEKAVRFTYVDRLESQYLIKVDRKRVRQVISNIIGNAVKYGPEKGLAIQTELFQPASPQDGVCLSLGDNGPGISEAKLPYVFDRFYRIDSERSKDGQSTGLGLAIARELIEAQGGRITVSNNDGAGSCFTIWLPASEKPAFSS
jgi:signal transduction histidine kinase